jgi:hypothetical protein
MPVQPLTRDIVELIEKSSYGTQELQYFISSTVTLELHNKDRGPQTDIDIDRRSGQGVIKKIDAPEKIIIPKDTGGIFIPEPGSSVPGGPRTLKICFSDRDDQTLTFREEAERYYLVAWIDKQYGESFTEYGGESYRVILERQERPYLYVKLDMQTDDQPRTRQLPGRYVSDYYSEETNAPPPAEEAAPAAVQETVAPGRSPQPPAPEPAPQTPPTAAEEDEDEELDLEAMLGL